MSVSATTVRIDNNDRAEAADLLESMGISFNGYLTMAVKQLVNQRRIPFDIVPATYEPNEATRRALVAAEAKELGLLPDDAVSFESIADAMAWLDEE
ncbi:type II toxin-antitoxin system RelB/DinJ family antitoxin [Atopobiaceae bacterium 24-176]